MARLPRYAMPGQAYHVIQRGNNRGPVFLREGDYSFYRGCLKDACSKHGCSVHAFVLMTNHVHLLLTPDNAASIPRTMQSIGRRYVQHVNRTYSRTGTLWEGRYRATLIDSEAYLLTCYRYIELNPVRAGLAKAPGDYRWSSYQTHAFGKADALVRDHALYLALGDTSSTRQKAYVSLFPEHIESATLHLIRQSTNKAWALGSETFKARVETELHRRAGPIAEGMRRRMGRAEAMKQG